MIFKTILAIALLVAMLTLPAAIASPGNNIGNDPNSNTDGNPASIAAGIWSIDQSRYPDAFGGIPGFSEVGMATRDTVTGYVYEHGYSSVMPGGHPAVSGPAQM